MTKKRASLPGDLSFRDEIERMIRVNQAGEHGAVQIYKGQISVLGNSDSAPLLRHMLDQEKIHLDQFNQMMTSRKIRPTALSPLWSFMGYALGAGTALLGKNAAMACTVAVEEVIDEHYAKQQKKLKNQDPDLHKLITKCREEEAEHKQTGLDHGAEQAIAYPVLAKTIKASAKLAIWLSTRI